MNKELDVLKYPIGRFKVPHSISDKMLRGWIEEIEALPTLMSQAVKGLTEEQLNTPYRPEGWTLRQVVHHVADSHINSYVRFKWALTEEIPTIKAYNEQTWARLEDYSAPVEISLALLTALHTRWTLLLKSLSAEQFKLKFVHPESGAKISLDINTALYAWHGKHHLAHIEGVTKRMKW